MRNKENDADIVVIKTGSAIIKEISGQEITLSNLEGWHNLQPLQQSFFEVYCDTKMQETATRVALGISKAELEGWKTLPDFKLILDDIDSLFTEGLTALDYLDSLTNSKIRGRVLQARNAKGYEKKAVTTTNNVITTSNDELAKLLRGY